MNPLLKVDTVTINTFIPHNNVDDPLDSNRRFAGDNRNSGSPARATWDEEGSHRTQQKFKVIANRSVDINGLVDNAFGPNVDSYRHIAPTRSFEASSSLDAQGNLTQQALNDTVTGSPLMIATATAPVTDFDPIITNYTSEKVLEINCRLNSNNPLVTGSPAINYTLKLTINRDSNTYTLTGTHDGFPAYEVYINGKRIYEHDPLETGEGLGSLFPPEEHSVNETGAL